MKKLLIRYLILTTSCLLVSCAVQSGQILDLIDKESKNGFTPAPRAPSPDDSCPQGSKCVLPVQCPAHVYGAAPKTCRIGRSGICCSTGQNHTGPINEKARAKVFDVTNDILRQAVSDIRGRMEEILHKERVLQRSSLASGVRIGSPSHGHARNMQVSDKREASKISELARHAVKMVTALRALKKRFPLTKEHFEFQMFKGGLQGSEFNEVCVEPVDCPVHPPKFRPYDGTCNNVLHPEWGTEISPFHRLLPPAYDDGIWEPRKSSLNGMPLPNARLISNVLFRDNDRPNPYSTLMVMQFGQFLSHDIARTIEISLKNGTGISCCTEDGKEELPEELSHLGCMPITVDPYDNFFSNFEIGCINFVRSVLIPRSDCGFGHANQMNKVSHFIDGSAIYGSSFDHNSKLRELEGGRLRMMDDFGRQLLPLAEEPDSCLTMERGSACFTAGDGRTNQMISLVVMHTIFAREHNRIAAILTELNPSWEDEQIFQEARRIVVAELQHIVYSEWLPEVIGHNAMYEFGLHPEAGYSNDYDISMDPSVTNEFSTAALRFGHSVVDGKLRIHGKNRMEEMIDISETMFFPSRMRRVPFLDGTLQALMYENIQHADVSVTESLTNYMFRAGNPFGVDLIAFNIQRGRDHGLRPYNDYRELVGLPRYQSFEQFGPEAGYILQKLYSTVDDVDLYVGALTEEPAPQSIVGPTFRDIIADQFVRLKKGDRYFYNLHPSINPGHFTPDQLYQIQRTSLSRIICDNADGVLLRQVTLNPFKTAGNYGNNIVDCDSPAIPGIDLTFWRDDDNNNMQLF